MGVGVGPVGVGVDFSPEQRTTVVREYVRRDRLSAVPQQPGFAMVYYHTSIDAGGDVAVAMQIEIGRLKANVNVNLDVNLKARAELGFVVPSYVFDTEIIGGQFAVSMLIPFGKQCHA